MKLKKGGMFSRISATVVALMMVLFSTISVAYGLGDNDGVDETPVVATEPAESTEEPTQEAEEQSSETAEPEKAEVVEEVPPAAEVPDATEEVAATETSDNSDAAADKAAAEEKKVETEVVKEAATATEKTTKKEPKTTSAPGPKTSASPSTSVEEEELPAPPLSRFMTVTKTQCPSPTIGFALLGDPAVDWVEFITQNANKLQFGLSGEESVLLSASNPNQPIRVNVSVVTDEVDYVYVYDAVVSPGDNCTSEPSPSPTPTEEPEPRPVDVTRDPETGAVVVANPKGNPPVVVVVRDKDDKELERVSLEPGKTGTVETNRCEPVSIGTIVGDADEQFWGEFPAEDCTPMPSPSPSPTETVKPSPTPTPEPTAPEPTPSATPTPTQEPTRPVTPKPSPTTEPTSDKDGGSKDKDKKGTKPKLPKSGVSDGDPTVAIVGATVLAAVVSAGGLAFWRRRA